MLPPALGGLRVCVPPVPGHPAPGSVAKIMFQGDCPLGTPQLYQKSFPVWRRIFWQFRACGIFDAQGRAITDENQSVRGSLAASALACR